MDGSNPSNTEYTQADPGIQSEHLLADDVREAVYKTIFARRDTRGQFKPDPVPDDVLSRILTAAHYAPSVGFMQPWSFMVIREAETKARVHDLFAEAHAEAAEMFSGEKREVYRGLKLEGIKESPVNLVITCDRERAGPVVVGRTHIKTMDLYSTVCAVQNLWLAARTEGLGIGWVSIFHQRKLQDLLGIPSRIIPVAYLCVGYVDHFYAKPELETAGWRPRLKMSELVHAERWGETESSREAGLRQCLDDNQAAAQAGHFISSQLP